MSTRPKRPRCTVCRNPLPKDATGPKCGPCKGQTVLFPKRTAERLSRPTRTTGGGQ
ncbi:hypothetical protein AB0L00_24145 [Actinoallomurus sp. NPDC052308]|uniref:hypothetical protein n=1 Tax=Actinoallomurus sp. NPDC052308 TaxID=3155530 RepID=UPI00343901F3